MKIFLQPFFLLLSFFCFSQNNPLAKSDTIKKKSLIINHDKDKPKAKYEQYRIISLERDTTFIDTSLTVKSLYKYNYLRKDNFGLLAFANEGHTYNTLNFGLTNQSAFPSIGFNAKHFNFQEANKIKYYSVATPYTELYFKTVMEQGQTLDALISVNTSDRLNFSIGYKGLRSLGKYINQLSSSGNFVFTTSYSTKNQQYIANAHFTGQDILNGENGGLATLSEFESGDKDYKNRARINVLLKDATSLLKGKRFFLDHSLVVSGSQQNNITIFHQINYENKTFIFNQPTLLSTIGATSFQEFGPSYVSSGLDDHTSYNKLYNKLGVTYKNETLGKFQFFAEDFRDNSYYNNVLFLGGLTIPSALSHKIQTLGGQYDYQKGDWAGTFSISKAITKQTLSNLDANLIYAFNDENQVAIEVQNISKQPNNNYNLYQSNYINYNWSNNFDNENLTTLKLNAKTQWVNAAIQASIIKNHLYFSNDNTTGLQFVSPKQYAQSISYLSFKASKEIKFRKFSLDNTLLFQEVTQDSKILNLPNIVTRNTVYYTDYFFKRALFLQTGISFNYFTKYYGDDYNPVIGEFFTQKTKKIGGYPNLDFYISGRIRQTRIFIIAEHFNSGFSGSNFLSAPNYPYRDFVVRFGLVWNFFQ